MRLLLRLLVRLVRVLRVCLCRFQSPLLMKVSASRWRSSHIRSACSGSVMSPTAPVATFKIPSYWKFVDEFPTTVTGKVQKFRMREMAVAELGLQTAATQRTA